MKKFLSTLLLISFLTLPMLCLGIGGETAPTVATTYADIITIITRITDWIFGLLLAFVVVYILLAAFQFLTAAGDADKVASAKTKLTYAVIGTVVAFLAKSVVPLMKLILGL